MSLLRISGLALALCSASAWANLVTNGSFEEPVIPAGTYSLSTPSIPGWTLAEGSQGEIEIQHDIKGTAYDGFQFIELDSHANSAVYQDLFTTIGGMYNLAFYFSARPGTLINQTNVYWNGILLDTIVADGTGLVNSSWVRKSYTGLIATSNSTRLQFEETGPSDTTGSYLDAVNVSAVPEPGSVGLLASGLAAGLGLAIRRRRAQRQ